MEDARATALKLLVYPPSRSEPKTDRREVAGWLIEEVSWAATRVCRMSSDQKNRSHLVAGWNPQQRRLEHVVSVKNSCSSEAELRRRVVLSHANSTASQWRVVIPVTICIPALERRCWMHGASRITCIRLCFLKTKGHKRYGKGFQSAARDRAASPCTVSDVGVR